jgi:hypothetical protein
VGIARWDGKEYEPLGLGIGAPRGGQPVFALTEYRGDLVAGGWFSRAGDVPASNVARWDGTSWWPLGGGITSGAPAHIRSLTSYDGELIAGGVFSVAGTTKVSSIAAWDGARWHALGTGLGTGDGVYVSSLATRGRLLHAGGRFSESGGYPSPGLARWGYGDSYPLGDLDCDGDVDLDDFTRFTECLAGPGVLYAPGCLRADFDDDEDVDLSDFGILQSLLPGQ